MGFGRIYRGALGAIYLFLPIVPHRAYGLLGPGEVCRSLSIAGRKLARSSHHEVLGIDSEGEAS